MTDVIHLAFYSIKINNAPFNFNIKSCQKSKNGKLKSFSLSALLHSELVCSEITDIGGDFVFH